MDKTVYLEQLVKREGSILDWVKRIGILVLGILLCFVLWFLLSAVAPSVLAAFFPVLFALTVWGIWIFWRRQSKEYEYIYTDGNLDVDCVYHRGTRRSMVSIDCREFEVIAPAENPDYQKLFERKYDKVLDAGRGGIRENTYIAICNRENRTLKMMFEPNERILEAMKKYIPRKLILRP